MYKKIVAFVIVLFISLVSLHITAFAATAAPTASTVSVDGKNVVFDAYNISDYNYIKLRDIAYIFNGTAKQFAVRWDEVNNSITLKSGLPYVVSGDEMAGAKGGGAIKTPVSCSSKVILDEDRINLTAYTIDGYNYFRLRDIGKALNFSVEWDAAYNAIIIDTTSPYHEDFTGAPDDIATLIDKNLKIISDACEVDEYDGITAYPVEFNEIVALQDRALPYLEQIISYENNDKYPFEDYYWYRVLAAAAKYKIAPDSYDYIVSSPDGKYTVKATIYSFIQMYNHGIAYGKVYLADTAKGTTSLFADLSEDGLAIEIQVDWSSDSRYAAIYYIYHRATLVSVIDTKTTRYTVLPDMNKIKKIIGVDEDLYASFSHPFFRFVDWETDERVKVEFTFIGHGNENDMHPEFTGWYIFDMASGEITDFEYEVD